MRMDCLPRLLQGPSAFFGGSAPVLGKQHVHAIEGMPTKSFCNGDVIF